MTYATLEIIGRQLCIKISFPAQDTPELIANYFPILGRDCRDWIDNVGQQLESTNHEQWYFTPTRYNIGKWLRDIVFYVDGSAKSIKTLITPIPPPRVRKGTEYWWNYGKWIKRTARGIVTA